MYLDPPFKRALLLNRCLFFQGYCGQAEREKWHPNLGKKDKRWAGSGKASSGGGADVAAPAAARKPAAPSRAAGGNASGTSIKASGPYIL